MCSPRHHWMVWGCFLLAGFGKAGGTMSTPWHDHSICDSSCCTARQLCQKGRLLCACVCAQRACLIAGSLSGLCARPHPPRARPPSVIPVCAHTGCACATAASQVCGCVTTPHSPGSCCPRVSNHGGLKNLFKSLPSKIVGSGVRFVWWYEKFFVLACVLVVV